MGHRVATSRTGRVDALVARLRSWLRRDHLDHAIARGDPLAGDLAVRARQLTRRSATAALAAELEAALGRALHPDGSSHPSAVDLSRDAIAAAAPDLRRLIEGLRADEPPDPRGVALATRLLRDIDSPLYEPARPRELRDTITGAVSALRREHAQRPASPPARRHTEVVMSADRSSPSPWPQMQRG